ncbi:permease [Paenibacillus sp. GCM10027626]|uniref:permease n=1 Tax=Paenibacillus sp. GCM10027626 TaxID=3273411 RepID=UPI003633D6C7
MQSFITFKTVLLGILLETLPFLLLGVIVSSFMHLFISESFIRKYTPRHPLLGIPFACILGFLFPICECGLIPIVRRLITKGMPLYVGIVFIVVGPIVNPVVLAATYVAFRNRSEMIYSRMGLALVVGVLLGCIVYLFMKGNPLKPAPQHEVLHNHHHSAQSQNKFLAMIDHAGNEFFDMGKYVMLGSILTAAIQSFLPRSSLLELGQSEWSSVLFMMGFAYILSLCSTSDAFVASSFATLFSSSSILAFLVFGPMLDFKSTLMLFAVFKKKFVILLSLLIFIAVLAGSMIVGEVFHL